MTNALPAYPVYPDDVFKDGEMTKLHEIRRGLLEIRTADAALEELGDNPERIRILLKNQPSLVPIIGKDASPEKAETRLQKRYGELAEAGVALLAPHIGMDQAETAMAREEAAIDDFLAQQNRGRASAVGGQR